MQRLRTIYDILKEVYVGGAYAGIALDNALKTIDDERDKAYITRVFYGVIEESVRSDYVISKLCAKKPKTAIVIILKIGLYCLNNMDMPDYAVVNNCVELTKAIGKKELSGFVNATLKKAKTIELSDNDLSIKYSYPKWIIDMLIKDYGVEFAEAFVKFKSDTLTHIRATTGHNAELFANLTKSKLGYYATGNQLAKLPPKSYFVQSLASMTVCRTLDNDNPSNILDLCSAPGGKAVYLKQLHPNAEITACDIHPHRLDLIRLYAGKAGVTLKIVHNDATVLEEKWLDSFDAVMCDVPCSGLGVAGQKPDILLNRKPEDIANFAKTQSKILRTAGKCVKVGGHIVYSTCTVLKKENEQVVDAFLRENKTFEKSGEYIKLFPHIDNTDGFFIAKLVRKPS
ncbi:MAG: methyltransferase domain-containing protein [Firmicutes bacterium]|nr:methyltransferase domain-containing protein [Bacillota bacterium]